MKQLDDNEAVYDAEIAPLMNRIIDICRRSGIPCFATFAYKPDSWCTTTIPREGDNGRVDELRRFHWKGTQPAASVVVLRTDDTTTVIGLDSIGAGGSEPR